MVVFMTLSSDLLLRIISHKLTEQPAGIGGMLDINAKIVEQEDVALLRKALSSVWSADIDIMKAFSPEKLKKKECTKNEK